MTRGLNEFLKGLRIEGGEASQKEVAEEAIKKQLFRILDDLNLKKGETVDLDKTVEKIANSLGLQENKVQIAQYITKLFQSDEYQFDIDDNGNIRANYSRLYMIQKANDQRGREEAEGILYGFIQKVETYIKELEQQKVKITEVSVMHRFSEEELRKNGEWIDLAIDHVLEMRKKQETIK